MNDVIPLNINKKIEANGINGLLGNLSNVINNFEHVFSKFNLSPQNIERSLKTLQTINSTIGSSNNSARLSAVSKVLDASYKFSTIQDVITNLNIVTTAIPIMRNSDVDSESRNELPVSNINHKILDASNALLSENSKKKIKQAENMMYTITTLQKIKGSYEENNNIDGRFDIKSMLEIIKPLLGAQGKYIDNIGDLMEMFSLLNNRNINPEDYAETDDANKDNI